MQNLYIRAEKADGAVTNGEWARYYTEMENWRLMGFSDADFDKASKVNSNSQLYKQAGNSIVTTVLMAIFGELTDTDWRNKIKEMEDRK